MSHVGPPAHPLAVWAVAANVLLDQLGLPVPATPALLLSGATYAPGSEPARELLGLAVLASVLANLIWFWLGQRFGVRVLRLLCRLSVSPDSCVGQSQRRFERWGEVTLLVAKFIPGLSVMAPALAGALRMRTITFLGASIAAATLWVSTLVLLGALIVSRIGVRLPPVDWLSRRLLLLFAGLFALYAAVRWWQRRRFRLATRMERIGPSELQTLLKGEPAAFILDVRSATARALDPRAIPGALQIPADQVLEHLDALPIDRPLVLYCTCPNEASAAAVARQLTDRGFRSVRPLQGGLDAWIAAGYPVENLAPLPQPTHAPSTL